MLSQRVANIVFVILVLTACVWFAIIAEGFETSGLLASSGLPSKFFPQLTLAVTGLCAIVVGFAYWVRRAAGADAGETVFGDSGDARRGLLMLVVAIACFFIWKYVGFIPMAVAMGPLSLAAMGVRSIWIYLTVLVLTAVIYVIFTQLLGVHFT